MRPLLANAVIIMLLSVSVLAQTGFPPYGSFQGGQFETINRQNLNVNFAIPIINSPGRGFALSHVLRYDSLIWYRIGSYWQPVTYWAGNPNWGWKLENPTGSIQYSVTGDGCTTYDEMGFPVYNPYLYYSGFAYVDPQGTVHPFDLWAYTGMGAETCGVAGSSLTGYSASGYYMDATTFSPVVTTPTGMKIYESGNAVDVNGNLVSKTVSGATAEWKDTAGRVALKITKASNYIDYLYLDGASSTSYQTIRVNLTTISVKTNFACSGVVEYTGNATVPSSISLPNGRSYSFEYETNSTYTSFKTGRVSKVTLPTGGYIEYLYPGSNNGVNCSDGSLIKLEKEVNDGSKWIFTRSNVSSTTWKTIVTDPVMPYDSAGNEGEHIFTNGLETSHKIFQGAVASGTLLQTIETTWAGNGSPASRTVTLQDTSTKSTVSTSFDNYGNLLSASETDWYTGTTLPSPARTTSYSYLSSSSYTARNIRNRVTQIVVTSGGGTKSRTDIAYDESGYINSVNVTGAQQHDDTNYGNGFTYRGLPTTVTTYANAAAPSGGVVRHTYYDTLGNVVKADMNCCQQKQFNYSSTTQYSVPDSLVHGSSGSTQLTESAAYNAYTGMVATSTDSNNKTTTYSYDALKRVTAVQRPDGTTINTTYDDTNRIVRAETPVQGSDKVRQRTYLDDLGRPIKVTVTNASDTQISVAETQYDPLGRPYKQSTPHNGTAQYWTESRFDALGRPTVVIPPGANATSGSTRYTYSGKTVTVTDPADKQRKSESDGLGRTIKVYEPDVASSNALTQETSYVYNALDLLTTVNQGLQTRTYAYDDLGRMTSQTTPEAGQWSYQYNAYDLVTQRTDARGVITSYAYDTLNRLTGVSYNVGSTGVPATSSVSYAYGTSTSSNENGQLKTVSDGLGSETYTYDSLGRTTSVAKVISGTTYTTTYAYNLANEMTSITYPSGRVVEQQYDSYGRLSAVLSGGTTHAGSFAYNQAGRATGYSYANGVAATFEYYAERLQLKRIKYEKTGGSVYFNDEYQYTGHSNGGNNGQITGITDNVETGRSVSYTYDALHRLKTAVTTGSTTYPQWGLSWTYDRYGNRSAQSQTAGSPPANSLTFATTSGAGAYTNRPDGYSHDANGNMTNDGANTLTYDAENRVVAAGGATYSYDGGGLRLKKISGGTTTVYVYSGAKVIAEYVDGAGLGSPKSEYIYAGSQLVSQIDRASVVVRFTNDSCSGCSGGTPVGGGDRNLFVNSITIGSTTILGNDSTVSYTSCNAASGTLGVLACTGDMRTTSSSNVTSVTVSAYGSPDYSVYPHMQLWVNGTLMGEWDVTGSTQNYTVAMTRNIAVRFTNDSCSGCGGGSGGDRNLFVNSITMGTTTIYPNDSSVSYTAAPCNRTENNVGYLLCNGDMLAASTASATSVTVNAYGTSDYGVYPHMQLWVDGLLAGEWDVTGSSQNYSASVPLTTTRYFHADHLSNRVVTNSNGAVVSNHAHYPYGEDWTQSPSAANKLKFTSYERDSETGNDYAMARYHINRLGRFNRPDPVAGNVYNPQRLNRYAYALNNPVNLIDPLGLDVELETIPAMGGGSTYWGLTWGTMGGGGLPGGGGGYCPAQYAYCTYLGGGESIGHDGSGLFEEHFSHETESQAKARQQTVKDRIRDAIKNKACAELLGGLAEANAMLEKMSVASVYSPGWKPANPTQREIAADIRYVDANPAVGTLYAGVDIGMSRATHRWNRGSFTVLTGKAWDKLSGAQRATVVIHELYHVVNPQPGRELSGKQIAKACATAGPPQDFH